MEGSPVLVSLADALAGQQMDDPRTPKKISLTGGDSPTDTPTISGPDFQDECAVSEDNTEAVEITPQKIALPVEALDAALCRALDFSMTDFPMTLFSPVTEAGSGDRLVTGTPTAVPIMDTSPDGVGIMGTTPLVDPSTSGYFDYFADPMLPALGAVQQYISLFQGLLQEQPAVPPMPGGPEGTCSLLAAIAEETSDPVLAALAATSPMKSKSGADAPSAQALDAPPGLPLPSRQARAAAGTKACSEAPPGLEGWASDDSTSPGSTDGRDAPSSAGGSDSVLASPSSDIFTMSPEAAPFVPVFSGIVPAPLDPLTILATAPPESPADSTEGKEDKEEAKHGAGSCRPCAWFWKDVGCSSGKDCEYCHLCPKGALKAQKKVRRAMIRSGQASSPGVQHTLTPTPGSPNFVLSLSALL